MTVKYTVVPKRNPRQPEAPPRYYAQVKSSGKTALRQLANRIAAISTVSSVDTLAVLEALLTVIPEELAAGQIVHLGDFGSFSLQISSEGSDTPEEVTVRNITGARARFRAGREFDISLERITFEKQAG